MFPDDVDDFLQHTPGMTLGSSQHGTMHNEVSAAVRRVQQQVLGGPEFGPALTFFEGQYIGADLADGDAQAAAFIGIDLDIAAGYEAWPGVQPVLGEWSTHIDTQRWRATEPGVYTAYVYQTVNFANAQSASDDLRLASPQDAMTSVTWGPDRVPTRISPVGYVARADYLPTLFVSEGLIDAGFGGFDIKSPYFTTSGAARINSIYLFVMIARQSPGSTFDYYPEL